MLSRTLARAENQLEHGPTGPNDLATKPLAPGILQPSKRTPLCRNDLHDVSVCSEIKASKGRMDFFDSQRVA